MNTATPFITPSRLNEFPTVIKKIGAEQPIETIAYETPKRNIEGSCLLKFLICRPGIFIFGW